MTLRASYRTSIGPAGWSAETGMGESRREPSPGVSRVMGGAFLAIPAPGGRKDRVKNRVKITLARRLNVMRILYRE